MKLHNELAKYYDLLSSSFIDYQSEVESLDRIFRKYNVKEILDVGCGTANHIIYLSKKGYRCYGLDASEQMLNIAIAKSRRENVKIKFFKGDIRTFILRKKFDAIISLYVLSYMLTNDELKKVLKNIYTMLKTDGLLIFNVINAEANFPEYPTLGALNNENNIKIVRFDLYTVQDTIADWKAVYFIECNGSVSIYIDQTKVRQFHINEIREITEQCGFKIEKILCNLAKMTVFDSKSSKGNEIFIIARRR